jgi:hypothetical protein
VFGFQSPEQVETDDENSACVWIEACNEEAALTWGKQVAEKYIRDHWPDLPRWKESNYAAWIETTNQAALEWAKRNPFPVCKVGEFPNW